MPEPARTTLGILRERIRAAAPKDATECILYRMPAFRWQGPLVGYAAHSNHCGFYVMHGTLLERFASDLKKYTTSKGGIQFPLDKPLPAALVKKLVKARAALNAK